MRKFWRRVKKSVRSITARDILAVGVGALLMVAGFRLADYSHRVGVPLAPQSDTITTSWLPDTVLHWRSTIEADAKRYNIDPNLVAIIMTMESGGYAAADSGQAQGLMQIAPATGKDIATRYVKDPPRLYDLKDPMTSIEFGTAYLAKLRDIYGTAKQGPSWDSTVELIAAAYNGGFGAANSLEKGEGLTDTQTVVYSRDAFNMWRERYAAKSPTFDRWKERGGADLINKAHDAQQ